MDRKRRKVENENRQFCPEWMDLYCFILPDRVGALPVCLICNQTVAVMKVFNTKRYYETHKSFAEKFPLGTGLRKTKIENLKMKYKSATQILSHAMTEQQKCAQASLQISWILGKHMKPFTDADIVKECMLQSLNILFENKKEIVETFRHIPISASTNTRNIEVLAKDNHNQLKQDLSTVDFYSIALDESCDITDTSQLIIHVRYLSNISGTFYEELLTLLPLSGTSKGNDLYNAHRLFKALLQENDTQFDDLLLHNNVRWLSKGNVLQRFFNLLNEIELFLIQSTHLSAKDYHEFISDNSNIATIAFLTDIFQHINSFNLKLQGNQKLICHLVSEVNCFCRKIDFFLQDVGNERLHFPNLKKVVDGNLEIDMTNFTKFLKSLKTEFERRFADFGKIKNVVQLLNSSFTLQPDGEWINEAENVFKCNRAHLQMEIIEFQSDDVLKNLFNEKYSKTEIDSTYDEFWLKYVSEKKYPTLKLLTVKMCTMFGSTYVCESAFSKMNYIKNKFRSRLTNEHLEMMMKIATTNHKPDLKQLVESKICHFSH
ncbi:general transcription factor II-I repeat domain-containing protein 2B-like [Melanaphis sacchari]|uniref:general transcription factor II-I repeat domain-containing protein 2B-like n=1 Tax=Melanaphis sacchari TaxID=742174 RepID=UPI000DC130C5|nr:general transcription factor II-I repeat domain-containing protein 2B-like [Melanaphis sacchari]